MNMRSGVTLDLHYFALNRDCKLISTYKIIRMKIALNKEVMFIVLGVVLVEVWRQF